MYYCQGHAGLWQWLARPRNPNHPPTTPHTQVIVIDEIGTAEECVAARTIAQRGVQLVATAHGNELENVIKNPSLSDLVRGHLWRQLGTLSARYTRASEPWDVLLAASQLPACTPCKPTAMVTMTVPHAASASTSVRSATGSI